MGCHRLVRGSPRSAERFTVVQVNDEKMVFDFDVNVAVADFNEYETHSNESIMIACFRLTSPRKNAFNLRSTSDVNVLADLGKGT